MNRIKSMFLQMIPFLIVGYTGWSFMGVYDEHNQKIKGFNTQIEGIKAKTRVAEIKLKKINKFKKDLESSKEKVKLVNQSIEKVQKQLPTNINDTVILEYLQNEAKKINVKDLELTAENEQLNGFYIAKNYKFKAVGTFLQFLIMFERLANSERLFNVKKLNIKNDGVRQKGRFTLVECDTVLESFKYNPAHVQKSGVDEIEKKYNVN